MNARDVIPDYAQELLNARRELRAVEDAANKGQWEVMVMAAQSARLAVERIEYWAKAKSTK